MCAVRAEQNIHPAREHENSEYQTHHEYCLQAVSSWRRRPPLCQIHTPLPGNIKNCLGWFPWVLSSVCTYLFSKLAEECIRKDIKWLVSRLATVVVSEKHPVQKKFKFPKSQEILRHDTFSGMILDPSNLKRWYCNHVS